MSEFKTYLEKKYMEWLSKRGRKGTVREFSELVGVDQRLMANWMNGDRKPGPEYADKIAIFLNYDLTVYDLLGIPRPDKALLQAKSNWAYMTDAERDEIIKILEAAEERHAKEKAQRPIPNT